jgi:hypothetical protein
MIGAHISASMKLKVKSKFDIIVSVLLHFLFAESFNLNDRASTHIATWQKESQRGILELVSNANKVTKPGYWCILV